MARIKLSRIVEQPHICTGCQQEYKGFVKADGDKDICPHCGKSDYHPSTAYTQFGHAPAADIQYNHGRGAESLAHGCHPSEVDIYRRACPSLQVRDDGAFIARNRTHWRRCLREMKAAGLD